MVWFLKIHSRNTVRGDEILNCRSLCLGDGFEVGIDGIGWLLGDT
jgi:hypothetical protein